MKNLKITQGETFKYSITEEVGTTYTFFASGPRTISGNFADGVFSVDYATTSDWEAGTYSYVVWGIKGSERYLVENGTIQVLLSPENDTSIDRRTHYQKVIDSIDAVIERRATKDQMSYKINDRELQRMSVDDLLKLRDYYISRLRTETKGRTKRIVGYFA